MAKPIKATPSLNKEESEEFIREMVKTEKQTKPTKTEQFFIDAICGKG